MTSAKPSTDAVSALLDALNPRQQQVQARGADPYAPIDPTAGCPYIYPHPSPKNYPNPESTTINGAREHAG